MKFFSSIVFCFLLVRQSVSHIVPPAIEIKPEQNGLNVKTDDDTLIFAHVIYRHGERNIVQSYPNDPYHDEVHWPEGFGQLTNEGKMQQFRLGKYFRKRYNQLLGDKYSPAKVYVRSTDFDRTLMSGQANLAGLFLPTEEEQWNEEIMWQPIPVHTVPRDLDYVVASEKKCPAYDEAFEQYTKESKEVQRIYTEYAHLFPYWSKMCGSPIKTIQNAYYLHNTLMIERDRNKTLPDWAEEALKPNGPMESIAKFNFRTGSDTPQLARLKSGFLLKEILDRFSKKANSTLNPDHALWFYSAHDFTISSLLNSLGLFEPHFPPYACSVHFELYKNNKNEHYVQIFYRKSGEKFPAPINVPKCGEKCQLKQFYKIYKEIIPGDFETECGLS